jgi:hypothetical protein
MFYYLSVSQFNLIIYFIYLFFSNNFQTQFNLRKGYVPPFGEVECGMGCGMECGIESPERLIESLFNIFYEN